LGHPILLSGPGFSLAQSIVTSAFSKLVAPALERIPILGKVWSQRNELRSITNRLWVGPGHFYSPIPDMDEIRQREAEIFSRAEARIPGVDLNDAGQLRAMRELAAYYPDQPFHDQPTGSTRYGLANIHFSYSDALFLYAMIRHAQPRRIIEIGSGYSSCVTLDTNELFFESSIDCTFIEPYPQLLHSMVRDGDLERATLIASKVQEVDRETFDALEANDILFIDSTHVARTGSDVNHLFFEVLPRLAPGVFVHIHDIFFPFEYPSEWVYQGRAWNEAYLLHAFLQFSDRFSIIAWNSYLERFHRDEMLRLMPLCAKHRGQSIWLQKNGGPAGTK
jgi:predicted O-methyltransferase YrrM